MPQFFSIIANKRSPPIQCGTYIILFALAAWDRDTPINQVVAGAAEGIKGRYALPLDWR
jgi:hypothetical protein